jgi:hypothetical protein
MSEYEFTLRFMLPWAGLASDELVERLGEAGCDDALIGVGHAGRIALEFARTAVSARVAVLSAIRDVRTAVPEAQLIEVSPDIVGLTDVAEIVGCSRQNMRKLLVARGATVPAPLHEGTCSLWHLAPVLRWLVGEKRYEVAKELLEVSEVAMSINVALDVRGTDDGTREELRALLA